MVKLEGGVWLADTIKFLTERGIPVCAHIGLTPQSVHQLGGFKVQGKTSDGATQLHADALAVQQAGASLVVIEAVPATLGKEVTDRLAIPTIGIGASATCDGQVLVVDDMLGMFTHAPRFVKKYADLRTTVLDAAAAYTIPAKISFVADVAQFTPKTVETDEERQKLMFRVKAQIPEALLKKYIQQVKTGLPGVAYVNLDPAAPWPESLTTNLVQ